MDNCNSMEEVLITIINFLTWDFKLNLDFVKEDTTLVVLIKDIALLEGITLVEASIILGDPMVNINFMMAMDIILVGFSKDPILVEAINIDLVVVLIGDINLVTKDKDIMIINIDLEPKIDMG